MRLRALARWAPVALGAAAVVATPAVAAPPAPATKLAGVTASGPVRDVILPPRAARASRLAAAARVERFEDARGRAFSVGSDLPGGELSRVASIVAGTVHGDEIKRLRVRVVALEDMATACAPDAVACYAPDSATRIGRARGEMVVAHDDPDLVHTVVHEYGHHIDAQLWNFSADGPCGGLDGSRRWLFAREADRLLQLAGCGADVPWERLLPEVFAEDFVALNGIVDWELPDFPAPTQRTLDALRVDMDLPYAPGRRTVRGRLAGGARRVVRFRTDAPAFLTLTLAGARRADLRLDLRRADGGAALASSDRPGSDERIETVVAPGQYRVVVRASRGAGAYRLGLVND
jgi:hypothetical protein